MRSRARARRDITVPTGMPASSAISLYDRPSNSRSTITSRNSSGNLSNASFKNCFVRTSEQQGFRITAAVLGDMCFFIESRGEFVLPVFLQPRITRIPDDPQQPRAPVIAAETVKRLQRTQIGVLYQVLRIGSIAGQPARQVVGGGKVRQHRFLEPL